MNHELEPLIASLRDELEQYGEMLARLDEQQEMVVRRRTDDIMRGVEAVQSQSLRIQQARDVRSRRLEDLAAVLGLGRDAGFAEVIPRLPADYRPMIDALVSENNQLLLRVRSRARQNHLLLSRSMELMQNFIRTLFPQGHGPVYSEQGAAVASGLPAHTMYEAVG